MCGRHSARPPRERNSSSRGLINDHRVFPRRRNHLHLFARYLARLRLLLLCAARGIFSGFLPNLAIVLKYLSMSHLSRTLLRFNILFYRQLTRMLFAQSSHSFKSVLLLKLENVLLRREIENAFCHGNILIEKIVLV